MPADPLEDVIRRRIRAGWIDVLIVFLIGVVISLIAGQSRIGHWTEQTAFGPVAHSGVQINLDGGAFFAWVGVALLYSFLAQLLTA